MNIMFFYIEWISTIEVKYIPIGTYIILQNYNHGNQHSFVFKIFGVKTNPNERYIGIHMTPNFIQWNKILVIQ